LLQLPVILGRMRLRLQAASRERCRLQLRLTMKSVRAFCTLRFFWRMYGRNNNELGGANWEYSFAPPKRPLGEVLRAGCSRLLRLKLIL
jgi:hypothetical protein